MSGFNKYQSQLNKASKAPSLYTGVTNFKVLGINPTEAQLTEILGDADKAHKFDTTYDLKMNLSEKMVRPVNIWIQDYDENISPVVLNLELGNFPHAARNTDSVRIVNNYLQSTWSASVDAVVNNPKMEWFSKTGIRVARLGEEDYYKFIATLLRYDLQGDVSFATFVADPEIGLSFDTVYGGNFTGLRGLAAHAEANDFVFASLALVKEKDTEDGYKYYQEIPRDSDLWYRSTTDSDLSWVIDNIKVKKEKKEQEGYNLTNRLFTYEFGVFSKDKCVNAAPETNTPTISSWT